MSPHHAPDVQDASVAERVRNLRASLPRGVTLVGAVKNRTAGEVKSAADGGLAVAGHNYVVPARALRDELEAGHGGAPGLSWHLIGHLQRNKARKALETFDLVETLDSSRLAGTLERLCAETGRVLPVFLEVNSGRESSKTGVPPDRVEDLARRVRDLEHLSLQGLMTMGPRFGDPGDSRPCFRLTRGLAERLAELGLFDRSPPHLSMGMSLSFRVAVEEGATLVRIGTLLFGLRS